MLRSVLLLLNLVIGTSINSYGQLLNHIRDNYKEIRSISPSDTDYSDLEIIGSAIGNARVVMLGEQDHGDAPTFLAKTRLIKYLHEKKGFNVFAIEGDFFALTYGWGQSSKDKGSVDSFLRNNIFSVWSNCDACSELFYSYISATQQSSSPLSVAGFDNQISGKFSRAHLHAYMDSLLYKTGFFQDLRVDQKKAYLEKLKRVLEKDEKNDTTSCVVFNDFVRLNNEIFENAQGLPSFTGQLIKSLSASSAQWFAYCSQPQHTSSKIRDSSMADNLRWLAESLYRNEKIIVWAASAHIMKNTPAVLKPNDRNWWYETMGTTFCNEYHLDSISYVLGFLSDTGRSGRVYDTLGFTLSRSLKGSLEKSFPVNLSYGFVDLRKYNAEGKKDKYLYSKAFGHRNKLAKWNKAFDGFFYIKSMSSCNRIRKPKTN